MELNGVANIKMLAEMIKEDMLQDEAPTSEYAEAVGKILDEVDVLERYMLALNEAHNEMSQPPAWHEVKANKKAFPNNRERLG